MFDMSIGVGEHILRAVIVYAFLFVLLRLIGKKHVGELAPFDLVVLLILSETVQNAMIADDKSLVGGLISAATLIAIAQGAGFVSWKSKKAARVIEGAPRVLVRHGHCYRDVMAREQVSNSELLEAMRAEGCTSILQVRVALLENDGKIAVIADRSPAL
jgi:uncharacterized membrane protein YcaP (DUF421 family)